MEEENEKTNSISDQTTWSETPWLALKGFLMGAADIIPGVSGGTMALITGIYDRLINAIRSVDKHVVVSFFSLKFKEIFSSFHWKFLLILLCGILSAIFFFTRIIPLQVYMYTDPEIIYGLFFGLILGSIFVLLNEVDRNEGLIRTVTPLVLGTIVGFWVVTLVPADTPENFWFVFLSGFIVFCALILPGISGSYLLLILGKYDYVLSQLADLGGESTSEAAWALFPLILGGLLSLILVSRLLSWLLQNYNTVTLMVLVGFLIGSLYVIWPWQERIYEENVADTDIHLVTDPAVRELKENPPDTNRPSYFRLGEVVNPEAAKEERRIEIYHIERELVVSKPYFPGRSEEQEDALLLEGIIGFLAGLVLVIALDYVRRKK